tara:strand:- start:67579 stop:67761 length:183 start_codon:yes stop_codon:yes gene_type:complete
MLATVRIYQILEGEEGTFGEMLAAKLLLERKKHLLPASSSKRRSKKIESPSSNLPPTTEV